MPVSDLAVFPVFSCLLLDRCLTILHEPNDATDSVKEKCDVTWVKRRRSLQG